MIAGTHSGVGKTTVMLGLAAALKAKGHTVQPFKGGPDYIDTGFHHLAAGDRRCRNLDLFLLSPETAQQTFESSSQGADVALVEGMMGLYDGKNAAGEGSSAEITKLLNLPVILVVDGSGMAASAAAMVLGYKQLDPQVRIAGVIFNRVNYEGHYQYLKDAVEYKTEIPCLGFLPAREEIKIPERHLGLTVAGEMNGVNDKIQNIAKLLEARLDWDAFWRVSQYGLPVITAEPAAQSFSRPFRIAVARDEAFSFYYEDNFDLLKEAGARLSFFSPLKDEEIPQADLIYFGGGFPELYAEKLSENKEMISRIRHFYHDGGWIYAECGGLMYLCESFLSADGREFPMAGLVPGKTRMTERLQNFGYKELTAASGNFLFSEGAKARSHEFHHSVWEDEGKHAPAYILGERREGFTAPRLVASYQHLHFASVLGLAGSLIHHIVKERNFVC